MVVTDKLPHCPAQLLKGRLLHVWLVGESHCLSTGVRDGSLRGIHGWSRGRSLGNRLKSWSGVDKESPVCDREVTLSIDTGDSNNEVPVV